ncbi:MAG: PAS domain S-box protein, partial [Verrucomicrobia bacterium]
LQELQNDIAGKDVEVLFHAFMDHLPGMALVKNSANRYVFINRALARFLGLRGDKAEWFGKGPADLFRGEEMVRLIQETDDEVAATGQALLREAEVLIQGQPRHFLMSKFPIHLPDGRMWVGAVTLEITALRTAEAALAESQRRLETLVNNLPGAVYRCRNDEAWTMLYLSEAIHAISGYPAADFLNNRKRSYASIVHPDDVAKVRRDVDQAVALDEPFTLEYRIIHADGQVRWVWERGRPVTVGGELYLEGFITDVTERRLAEEEHHRLEQHIREQQRLEAIGQLAGGVAHEINNPITGIINYAEILEEALPEDSDLREFTREIRHESERIARIIRTLLAFARPERTSRQDVTVSSLVENVFALVRTTLQNDLIKVFTEIPPQPLAVNCRPEQLQQLLLNLIANAREALNQRYPKGDPNKILSVHAASFERDGRPWIRLTVEDHGPGIPQADLPHVLNPFFTTKNRTRHAGLGLTVAQSIAADHGGRIRIESRPGEITLVHVELPAANPPAAPTSPPAANAPRA